MLPRVFKSILVLVLSGLVAVLLGNLIGQGDFDSLILLCYAGLGIFLLTAPGYQPLLALGLLNPFILPIPLVHAFPFLAIMLGVCACKLMLRDSLTHVEFHNYQSAMTRWFWLFFGWVVLRYLMKPALPHLSGFGSSITGFRSYLSYAICLCVVLALPLFIKTRAEALKFFKWYLAIACAFTLVLLPIVFTKSQIASLWLMRLGVSNGFFDNGLIRILTLPSLGLVLVTLAMCPSLLPLGKFKRRSMFCLGVAAILLGGTRSAAAMAVMIVLLFYLLRLQFRRFYGIAVGLGLLVLVGTYVVETMQIKSGFGFLRILALTSNRVAQQTDATGTWEWRLVLWRQAWDSIQKQPFFGKGYGGVENAWVFSTFDEYNRVEGELNLAFGGVHNGFLASAYALGIPSTIFFLVAFAQVLYRSTKQALYLRNKDPVLAEMNQFIVVNLCSLLLAIYIGTDLNAPTLWFYLAFGVILPRFRQIETSPQALAEAKSGLPFRPHPSAA